MPKNHATQKTRTALKKDLGIRHTCAVALLAHPDADERELLESYLLAYSDITTYREAVDHLRQQQADPANQILCEQCGWTNGMVCPECPKGCGCEQECTGWRHENMRAASDDYTEDDDGTCPDCGLEDDEQGFCGC